MARKLHAQNSPASEAQAADLWSPFEPRSSSAWTVEAAGRLLGRLGLGYTHSQLRAALQEGPAMTLDSLFEACGRAEGFNGRFDAFEDSGLESDSTAELSAWWLRRMIETPTPLLERMTLFWCEHFGVAAAAVKNARLLAQHVRTVRKHALGRFDDLLGCVLKDPAYYLSFGASDNRKSNPNLHFGEILLGCHTVGPGAYGPVDAHAVARAVTGFVVRGGRLRFREREHDGSLKTVLGTGGVKGVEDLAAVLSRSKATARFIVRRLCRAFVSEEYRWPDELLEPLVEEFAQKRDIAALLRKITGSRLFFSPQVQSSVKKNPAVWAVGIARAFETVVPTAPLAEDLSALGYGLFEPPGEGGWEGGQRWGSTCELMLRVRLAEALFFKSDRYGGRLDPLELCRKHRIKGPQNTIKFFCDLFWRGERDGRTLRCFREALEAESGRPGSALRAVVAAVVSAPPALVA